MAWWSFLVGLASTLPITGAFSTPLLWVATRSRRLVRAWAVFFAAATMLVAAANLYHLLYVEPGRVAVYYFGGWVLATNYQVGIVYTVDALSALMGFLAAALVFAATLYSLEYIGEGGEEWYYTLLLGLLAGLMGVFYTGDAFNLFVMLEVVGVSAYSLVAYYRGDGRAVEAALKYAFVGSIATTVYFISLVIVYYGLSSAYIVVEGERIPLGTLNIAGLQFACRVAGIEGAVHGLNIVAPVAAVFISMAVWVFMTKAALFPNHFWLPDAHPAAPSPVSALLSGVVVKTGLYSLIRFIYTVYMPSRYAPVAEVTGVVLGVLVVAGALSSLVAGFMMLVQDDVKRLIAYSTVMHMGYVAMAVGLGTRMGLEAAVYHMVTHAVGKALFFFSAGMAIMVAGSRSIDGLSGVAEESPVAALGVVVAALGLAGAFPLGCFSSKLLLYLAFVERGAVLLAIVLIASSAMAFAAYSKLVYALVFKRPRGGFSGRRPGSWMRIVVLSFSALFVALGVFAPYIVGGVVSPVAAAVLSPESYYRAVFMG